MLPYHQAKYINLQKPIPTSTHHRPNSGRRHTIQDTSEVKDYRTNNIHDTTYNTATLEDKNYAVSCERIFEHREEFFYGIFIFSDSPPAEVKLIK